MRCVYVLLVPLEIPQHFRIDPSKPVTDRTADFLWNAVNTGPWRMQGFFRGYKVSNCILIFRPSVCLSVSLSLSLSVYRSSSAGVGQSVQLVATREK